MEVSKEILNEIVQTLDTGFRCFLNVKTLEIIDIPDEDQFLEADTSAWRDSVNKIKKNKKEYREIEKMTSHESFKVMCNFIDFIDDPLIKEKLTQAIKGHKPFANFKYQIDRSGSFRELWFSFKHEQVAEYVLERLRLESV